MGEEGSQAVVPLREILSVLDVASQIQREADSLGLGRRGGLSKQGERSPLDRFDEVVTSHPLRSASRKLFADGHYAHAVQAAFLRLNNEVKLKSGLSAADGDGLMRTAFSAINPILRMNPLKTLSERNEQRGYMDIAAGAMTGIRNPRAHEHDLEDSPDTALEMLTLANHLMRKLDGATKSRRRATGAK